MSSKFIKTQPKITQLDWTGKKVRPTLESLDFNTLPFNQKLIKDQQIVHFGPGAWGGNHHHQRTEWFVGFGELWLLWLDQDNALHEEEFNSNGKLTLIEIPPNLSHTVINRSKNSQAFLLEFADQKPGKTKGAKIL